MRIYSTFRETIEKYPKILYDSRPDSSAIKAFIGVIGETLMTFELTWQQCINVNFLVLMVTL